LLPPASLSQIIPAKRTPPLDPIDRWADFLDLKGEERANFLERACLEHCPKPIRQEPLKLKMQIQKMEQRMSKLKEQRQ
jgi:hypothetical protein